jgi:hypothetical protein
MRNRVVVFILLALLVVTAVHAQETNIVGPDTYPDGTNPLTGLPVENPENLNRRPLIVKVINAPAKVRPQAGLMQADIVWEHLLAGGVTRFSAIYLSGDVDRVGPIRSLRLVDFELTRIYRSLIVYSGVSQGVLDVVRGDPLIVTRNVGGGPCPPLCRDEGLLAAGAKLEWTLFGSTQAIRDRAAELGRDTTPEPVYGMAFSEQTPSDGVAADSIDIAYRATDALWTWDSGSGRWLRSQDGAPHMTTDGEQISAANVLILEDDHVEQPFVSDGYWGPGNYAFSVNLIGSGRIYLFRDGQYFTGEWRRATREDPLTYYDAAGNVLPFKPGNTFIQLVPRWTDGYQLTFMLPEPATATVTTSSANLRGGPATGYPASGAGFRGDTFPAIGRNNAGTWVQMIVDDKILWASTEIVSLGDDDIMRLPIARPSNEG